MAIKASQLDGAVGSLSERWNEALTGKQRAQIATALESQRNIPEYRWINVGELRIDENYQRGVSDDRVWQIVTNFDWRLFGALWVGQRRGGLYVVDGRHRLGAAYVLGKKLMPEVPCEVRRTTGTEEEARVFVELQEKRRQLSSYQRFQAKLIYGDPDAIAISKSMAKFNFKIMDGASFTTRQHDDTISNVGTVERIYQAHGVEGVESVLAVLRGAWNGSKESLSTIMMTAIARVFEMKQVSRDKLARALREKEVYMLVDRAIRFAHSNDLTQMEALAQVMLTLVE